jgi:hypothetical protein
MLITLLAVDRCDWQIQVYRSRSPGFCDIFCILIATEVCHGRPRGAYGRQLWRRKVLKGLRSVSNFARHSRKRRL